MNRLIVVKDSTNMSTYTDDMDDEYLDDPISLIAIEDIKTEKEECDDKDQVIDVSSDEEEPCTSAYGKKNFVLPVTFFDISRNVRLLNKCKPLAIRIVDCRQGHTYYTKFNEVCSNKSDKTCVEVEKCKSGSETKIDNINTEDVSISATKKKADEKQEEEKKRRSNSFYEKLKKRKEERKRIALKSKDLSQVDFKRNTGLVGLKITDTIFKQIVDSNQVFLNTKCNSVENKPIIHTENPTATITPDDTCKENCGSVMENKLNRRKSVNVEKKCKGSSTKCISESEKTLTTKIDNFNDNYKEKFASVVDVKSTESFKCNKNESSNDKTNIEPKSVYTVTNISQEKYVKTFENQCIKTKIKSIAINLKENVLRDTQRATIESQCNSATRVMEEKSIEKVIEKNKYLKNDGVALNCLGTSITETCLGHSVPRNDTVQDNYELNSFKSHQSPTEFKELDNNEDGNKIPRSLKISSNNAIGKSLKVKKASNSDNKNDTSIHLQKKATQISQTDNNNQMDAFSLNSDSGAIRNKSTSYKEASRANETKIVETVGVKDDRDMAGPNSPVIPCTTLTVRAGTPTMTHKLPLAKDTGISDMRGSATFSIAAQTQKHMSSKLTKLVETNVQKRPHILKISTKNHGGRSKFPHEDTSNYNNPDVPNAIIEKKCDTKRTLVCNQNSNIATLKFTEFKYPNSHTLATVSSYQNNAKAERSLSDQYLSKFNTQKVAELNSTTKPTSAGNIQTSRLASSNQTNPILQPNTQAPSKFSGRNAIIFRRPPITQSGQLPNYPSLEKSSQAIFNNRLQYQPMPLGSRPMRFHHPWLLPPPPPPPPPPQSPPNNNQNMAQTKPQKCMPTTRMPPTYLRGMDMGLNHWRFYNPSAPAYRPQLSVPRPQSTQANKYSFIGNTADGNPIKRINIPVAPNTVDDKRKMLAELNKSIMSPELTNNVDCIPSIDLKRKADTEPIEQATSKHTKLDPSSKIINTTSELNTVKIPEKLSHKIGYSPPILPIFTYQESFKIFSPTDGKKKDTPIKEGQHGTPLKRTAANGTITKLDKNHKKPHYSTNKDKAKKISFEDYIKKRVTKDDDGVVERVDAYKIRKYNGSKNIPDDYNQDQGYDSDSTVKL